MKRLPTMLLAALLVAPLALAGCGDKDAPAGTDSEQDQGGGEEEDDADDADDAAKGDATHGAEVFAGTCATCHGPDAMGIEGLGKSLHANAFVADKNDAEMLAFVKIGRPAGDPLNTTGVDMPPKGGNPSLTDQDLVDVIAYVRTLD